MGYDSVTGIGLGDGGKRKDRFSVTISKGLNNFLVSLTGLGCLLVVLGIVMVPVFTIWAMNTLFRLEIPVNFWTWLSSAWLSWIVCMPRTKS
jgi:hypothetical protein